MIKGVLDNKDLILNIFLSFVTLLHAQYVLGENNHYYCCLIFLMEMIFDKKDSCSLSAT